MTAKHVSFTILVLLLLAACGGAPEAVQTRTASSAQAAESPSTAASLEASGQPASASGSAPAASSPPARSGDAAAAPSATALASPNAPAVVVLPGLAASPSPGASTAAGGETCAAGQRRFEHALLATEPVCIPENPQRVAVADFAALDVMYSLDLPMVAVWDLLIDGWYLNMVPELVPSLKQYAASARGIGAIPIDLEALAAANPDLILVNSLLVSEPGTYEQFSAIAPTVVKTETNIDDWREYMLFYGAALNVSDRVTTLLDDYETRLASLRTALGDRFAGKTASHLQVNDPSTIFIDAPSYRGWYPLRDAGLAESEKQVAALAALQTGDNAAIALPFSNERIDLLDTDYIFMMNAAFDPQDAQAVDAMYEQYRSDPLWNTLPAVREGRFYLVDLAWQANGLISAHAVIDDMFRLVLKQEPSVRNPFGERAQ